MTIRSPSFLVQGHCFLHSLLLPLSTHQTLGNRRPSGFTGWLGRSPLWRLWSLGQSLPLAESSIENLLVRVRLGWALQLKVRKVEKDGNQGQKALQGLLILEDASDWEAYHFLFLLLGSSAGKSSYKEGEHGTRVPEMECLPPLHPGIWRYGLSAALPDLRLSLWPAMSLKLGQTGVCEVMGNREAQESHAVRGSNLHNPSPNYTQLQ